MNRKLHLYLNEFSTTPHSLRSNPEMNSPIGICNCDLAKLYHHYYLDNYNRTPPSPDPANFEYIPFISNNEFFRLRGDGLGFSTASKRNRSNELGQAFCRWFLHEHLNITYFAHMDKILNKSLHRAFNGMKIERCSEGDVPDYFCAENINKVFLAEAKGRYSSINFNNKEFENWRDQFSRVRVISSNQQLLSLKGFIVATRFVTEENRDSLKSTIYAEDPMSPGDSQISEINVNIIGRIIIADHYANIFHKLNQPLVATALSIGTTIPDELRIQGVVWEFGIEPLKGKQFVGGYWIANDDFPPYKMNNNGNIVLANPSLSLNQSNATFFGIEKSIFQKIVHIARTGIEEITHFPQFDNTKSFYSAISLLRDGTILSPLDFLRPIDVIQE